MANLEPLFTWIIVGLCASLSTGSIVGVVISSPLRTYQQMATAFVAAALTWALTSLVGGPIVSFLLAILILNQFVIFGLLVGLLAVLFGCAIARLDHTHRATRWSLMGSLAAWFTVSVGSATAYNRLVDTALSDQAGALPANFWACIICSMFMCTVGGAVAGGMVFRQTRAWRA
jgi:uncharacterized membrane protein